ncbi:MAG TPA: GNAT family acetyltransferase [Streptosporangiaceae bacterium]|jgi:ribosomal protein S18 acetylase RimI-like enzyme|nr:GNAT family acetyltransferase [Streptosporangiaceae bacterium]
MPPVIRSYLAEDREPLVALWSQCELTRPWNDPYLDIDRKLAADGANLVVLESGSELVGSVMVGYDGHRGWVNYLAVRPDHRGRGFGRLLMADAERRLRALGCPKLNLQVRGSNTAAIEFYRRLGFVVDDSVSLGLRLEHDAR